MAGWLHELGADVVEIEDVLPGRPNAVVPDYGEADSFGAMAERALALAPRRFAVAGHSMGGRVALRYGPGHPWLAGRAAPPPAGASVAYRARGTAKMPQSGDE